MKIKFVIPTALIAVSIAAASFFGYAARTSTAAGTSKDASVPTEEDFTDSYLLRIEYCEKLISDLEAAILKEKEENFLAVSDYRRQIEELESIISSLKAQGSAIPSPPDFETLSQATECNPGEDDSEKLSYFTVAAVEGGVSIIGYSGDDSHLTIPSEIDGAVVVSIGEEAFKGSALTAITISEGIREIDWFAFSSCSDLLEISIPSSVESIGHGAFDYCSPNLVIKCAADSYAARYAASWGLSFTYK